MREAGVDISNQHSKQLDSSMLSGPNLPVALCGSADESCPVVPPSWEKQHWPLDDPAKATGSEAEITAEFARVRDQTGLCIEQFVNQQRL